MKISYAITVCNEFIEIQKLLNFLLENKRQEDEIVVLWDSNGDKEIETYLRSKNVSKSFFLWYPYDFKNDFSDLKNQLVSHCNGDYIFQIDADEIPNEFLLKNLPNIIESNGGVEVILVPRVNIVDGIDPGHHINQWGWRLDEENRINWPDYQWRIWKNLDNIKWVNKVHERLDGFKTYSTLPKETKYSLYHHKTIEKQERQNEFYRTL
jgi:hypothetical protein